MPRVRSSRVRRWRESTAALGGPPQRALGARAARAHRFAHDAACRLPPRCAPHLPASPDRARRRSRRPRAALARRSGRTSQARRAAEGGALLGDACASTSSGRRSMPCERLARLAPASPSRARRAALDPLARTADDEREQPGATAELAAVEHELRRRSVERRRASASSSDAAGRRAHVDGDDGSYASARRAARPRRVDRPSRRVRLGCARGRRSTASNGSAVDAPAGVGTGRRGAAVQRQRRAGACQPARRRAGNSSAEPDLRQQQVGRSRSGEQRVAHARAGRPARSLRGRRVQRGDASGSISSARTRAGSARG